MPIKINYKLTARALLQKIERLFELSSQKIRLIEKRWRPEQGAPVITRRGQYTARGWTEWTQGFQFGSALLQFDATGDRDFLEMGRRHTVQRMASHVSHTGVHDHGFNNISTYGHLWRLMQQGKIPFNESEKDFYELALKASGAVQAARWTKLADGTGFIHSFNGPHSLFVDTIRSCRVLGMAHQLGHVLMGEQDSRISLLQRMFDHALNTARYSIYYGEGRDIYDVPGRTAHESVFNISSGIFRCPNSQQGYSPFSTWTRGLAWAILGFAELLEFMETIGEEELNRISLEGFSRFAGKGMPDTNSKPNRPRRTADRLTGLMLRAARASADRYLRITCADGIPMWDDGAPGLVELDGYGDRPSDPFNRWEPLDSSAAAIAGQGLIRLGNYLKARGQDRSARDMRAAGLTVASTLLSEPYLSTDLKHQGLLLHSVYHRPNGWDYIAPGQKIPNGESSMWGDYHVRELALLILRESRGESYYTFFGDGRKMT